MKNNKLTKINPLYLGDNYILKHLFANCTVIKHTQLNVMGMCLHVIPNSMQLLERQRHCHQHVEISWN